MAELTEGVNWLAVAVGTEDEGLSDFWMNQADMKVLIPMMGRVNSLNVSIATALIVYEALQIAKAGGIGYKAALDLMQKTKSANILERWETRFQLSGSEMTFNPGTNLYDKDLPLAAEVGKALGAEIPVVAALAALGIKLNGGKVSI